MKKLPKDPEYYTTQDWLELFQRVNRDCSRVGKPILSFSNVEAVAEQIHNRTWVSGCAWRNHRTEEKNYSRAMAIALDLQAL